MTDDPERDAFLRMLYRAGRAAGGELEAMRAHPSFQEAVRTFGEDRVHGWLVLEGLRLVRWKVLDECLRQGGNPDLVRDEWLRPGVLSRLRENSAYLARCAQA
jgi:hypothetical protein